MLCGELIPYLGLLPTVWEVKRLRTRRNSWLDPREVWEGSYRPGALAMGVVQEI